MTRILGIGTDILAIQRFAAVKDQHHLLTQLFNTQERTRAVRYKRQNAYWSKLFALKEAVFKALRIGLHHGSFWRNVKISHDYQAAVSGHLKKYMKNASHIHSAQSCSKDYALSFVLLTKE
jgi:phosphopantetheine--protein transferase-like protein